MDSLQLVNDTFNAVTRLERSDGVWTDHIFSKTNLKYMLEIEPSNLQLTVQSSTNSYDGTVLNVSFPDCKESRSITLHILPPDQHTESINQVL